ncbi:TetR/AcrR family transcriptional regulator [Oleiagrimonas sp. C23AA]|uniref:TetR/AcrR family transcriptional regulator n=1 Tax=Oleiagrimonas sp. C23AA TaxID=2719047 RepID=UPI00141F616B|nr:TetR/AcrR family transcriptional regulator [Oleiagrimonas sp. C23AA]NII09257.1 TetR/AcrR family transcriptional regulator [Oleiagrimonas sp. C23AA]
MHTSSTADRILGAARALFEDGGEAAVSMRRIAARAGIAPMTIYRHFPNRAALLQRLGEDGTRELTDRLSTPPDTPDPIERLLELQEVYLDYALKHPQLFEPGLLRSGSDPNRFPDDVKARRSGLFNVMADTIADGMEQGRLADDDPWEVAMTLWAHAIGLITLYRAERFTYDEAGFRGFYRTSLRRMLCGLEAEPCTLDSPMEHAG